MNIHRRSLPYILTIAILSLTGCGDDDSAERNAEQAAIDEEPCFHVADDQPVTAATTAEAAGDVSTEHTGYLVTLTDFEAGSGGYLEYQAAEKGDYGFFFTADVPFQVFDSGGSEVEIEESAAAPGTCTISRYHVVELEVGTYSLVLGGATFGDATVKLVIEALDHDHEGDDHDHEGDDHDHEGDDHDHEGDDHDHEGDDHEGK